MYVSSDNLKTAKLIYDDRRGIKESMFWDDSTQCLIYSMYTPGKIRKRHYLIQYNPRTEVQDTLQTFYTTYEHDSLGLSPYCRHIHLICKDPYTSDLYIGTGDSDEESAIYRSSDGGRTIQCVGRGAQLWRTLSFFFTKDYVFWTTDSGDQPQYISRVNRTQLDTLPVDYKNVIRFPLFNSAVWCNIKVSENLYLVGSNSEGQYYDDFHRVYGIAFSDDGVPTVYNVLEEKSLPDRKGKIIFHQVHPLCKDFSDMIWCFDNELGIRKFRLKKIN